MWNVRTKLFLKVRKQIFNRDLGLDSVKLDNRTSRQLEITVPFIFFGYQSQVDDAELDLDSSSRIESRGEASS